MQPNPTKQCSKCGFVGTKDLFAYGTCKPCQAQCLHARYLANKEQHAANGKRWREENRERAQAAAKRWRIANKDRLAAKSKQWAEDHRGDLKVYRAEWYAANKERHAANGKRYAEEHREKLKAYYAEHYRASKYSDPQWSKENRAERKKKDPEAIKRYSREWYARNTAQHLETAKRWKANNKDAFNEAARVRNRNRAARLRNDPNAHTKQQIRELLAKQDAKCNACRTDISSKFHADHIMPILLGGSNGIDNIQLLCPRCNIRKSGKHPDIWRRDLEKQGGAFPCMSCT